MDERKEKQEGDIYREKIYIIETDVKKTPSVTSKINKKKKVKTRRSGFKRGMFIVYFQKGGEIRDRFLFIIATIANLIQHDTFFLYFILL